MQLNVITGPRASGKTTKLHELLDRLGNQSPAGLISAPNYPGAALTMHVLQRITAGDSYILIDGCTATQLDHLRRMRRRANATGQAMNLTIHAAKKAE